MHFFGARTSVARNDPVRCERFQARVLNCFVWGLFLVYPQVSSTTLLIFACNKLEDGTEWLMADYRIQCWTPRHRLHVGLGCMWGALFPLGIPIAFLLILWRSGVPELAAWKRDCAWLRNIVQRALVIGVPQPFDFDPDTITTESISLEHLKVLHKVFVEDELPDEEDEGAAGAAGKGGKGDETADELALVPVGLDVPSKADGEDASPAADRDMQLVAHSIPSRAASALQVAAPGARVLALLNEARKRIEAVTITRTTTMKRTLSALLFRDERHHYLMQLLIWAKHDKSSLVAEPRDNQLRWRTYYEWRALRHAGVRLGARDSTERTAFFNFRFLFASFSVHAWFWESVDLFHKLFLTSLISFIAPGSSVQVIVATMFAFGMLLFTVHLKPYREHAYNQLVSLSMCNLFLFLFTGLLLHTDPDGISENKLAFQVIVGGLTTSIVLFTFMLFLREVWRNLLQALFEIQDAEDDAKAAGLSAAGVDGDADGSDRDDNDGAPGGAHRASSNGMGHLAAGSDSYESVHKVWHDGSGDFPGGPPDGAPADGELEARQPRLTSNGEPVASTPPPPSWVSRLASTSRDRSR